MANLINIPSTVTPVKVYQTLLATSWDASNFYTLTGGGYADNVTATSTIDISLSILTMCIAPLFTCVPPLFSNLIPFVSLIIIRSSI